MVPPPERNRLRRGIRRNSSPTTRGINSYYHIPAPPPSQIVVESQDVVDIAANRSGSSHSGDLPDLLSDSDDDDNATPAELLPIPVRSNISPALMQLQVDGATSINPGTTPVRFHPGQWAENFYERTRLLYTHESPTFRMVPVIPPNAPAFVQSIGDNDVRIFCTCIITPPGLGPTERYYTVPMNYRNWDNLVIAQPPPPGTAEYRLYCHLRETLRHLHTMPHDVQISLTRFSRYFLHYMSECRRMRINADLNHFDPINCIHLPPPRMERAGFY